MLICVSFAGVADGVGGWREYGVDPSQVPRTIMSSCSRLVEQGKFVPSAPADLLEKAYEEASMNKDAAMGRLLRSISWCQRIDWPMALLMIKLIK